MKNLRSFAEYLLTVCVLVSILLGPVFVSFWINGSFQPVHQGGQP